MAPAKFRLAVLFRQMIIAALAAVLLWSVLIMLFEERFIFYPDRYPAGHYNQASRIANLQDCWMRAEDGVIIHGWYAPADTPRATLVMSHGNAGNVSYRLEIIRAFQRSGFNVLMYDYRGYGRSEGSPSEEGIYRDGLAAYDAVRKLRGVDSNRIVLWGTSLGGAVAVDIALHRSAAALILESTFTSASDIVSALMPWMPIRLLVRKKLNSVDKIGDVHIPVLVMHGDHDRTVPIALGRRLFEAANEPKTFYTINGADHNNTYFIGGTAYVSSVTSFLEKSVMSVPDLAHEHNP